MQPHVFEINPSKMYASMLFTLTALSVISVLLTPIAWYARLALLVCVFFYTHYLLRRVRRIGAIRFENEAVFIRIEKEWLPATLLGDHTLTRWVSVLRFKTNKKKLAAVVFYDALPHDVYRHLLASVRLICLQPADDLSHQSPQK